MKRLFFLLLGCILLCPSAMAEGDGDMPEINAKKVGTLTVYFAIEKFALDTFMEYQQDQLIWESGNYINKIEDFDADNYKYVLTEGCEEDCDYKLPKSKVYTKTYEMNELTTENVGYHAIYKSQDGLTARLFIADFNGHECRSGDGQQVLTDAMKEVAESYVLSFETKAPGADDIYVFEDFVKENDGKLCIYTEDPDNPNALCNYIEDLWNNPPGWEAPSAYDKDGLLKTDLWQNLDMPDSAIVAYVAEFDALYICGRLYFRQRE